MSKRVKLQTGGYAPGGAAGDDQDPADVGGQGGGFNGAQGNWVAENEVADAIDVQGGGGVQDGGQGGGAGDDQNLGDVGGQEGGFNGAQGGDVAGNEVAGVVGVHGGGGGGQDGVVDGAGNDQDADAGAQGGEGGGVAGIQGGGGGGGHEGGGVNGDAWVTCLNGAFRFLTAALQSINSGVREIAAQGNPDHDVIITVMRSEYNNITLGAGQIGATIVVINGILRARQNFNRIQMISGLLRCINGNVGGRAINTAGWSISVRLAGIVLAHGDNLCLNRAVSRIHSGLGSLNTAMGMFQALQRALGPPNLFGADDDVVPAAVAHLNATAAGGIVVLYQGLHNGIEYGAQGGGNVVGAQGGIVQIAGQHLDNLAETVRMLWRAFWSIRRGVNQIRGVIHQHHNPFAVNVAMLVFAMNEINAQIVQMRDARRHICNIINHALELGFNFDQILHPFPDQMHWISNAAENIHRSGHLIHNGLLVCIRWQALGPAQTRIQFGLAQLHLALANVLLATQFFANLPPPAVILPE